MRSAVPGMWMVSPYFWMIILQEALKIRDFKIVDFRIDTILRGPVTRCKSNDLFSMTVNLFDFYLCFPGSCKQGKWITGPLCQLQERVENLVLKAVAENRCGAPDPSLRLRLRSG